MGKKAFLISWSLLMGFFYALGQARPEVITPEFKSEDLEFRIPVFLAMVMDDSGARVGSDTLLYKVKGQILSGNGFVIPKNEINVLASRTPWETTVEMIYAYRKKDKNGIKNLVTNLSEAQINNLLQQQEFLNKMAKAYSVARLIAAIHYKNGIITYTVDSHDIVNLNYLLLEDGKYKLSALVDDGSVAWNIGQYLQFLPKPNVPLKDVSIPDSIQSSERKLVTARMTEPNQWLTISTENMGYLTPIVIQDNGKEDLNPKEKEISFELSGTIFLKKGRQVLYTNALNYPANHIAEAFLIREARHEIEVYD